jgi:hypothetical protein
MYAPRQAGAGKANIDWIRKKASAILERVLRFGTERLRDQEKPYEDYRM